ncbi:MAG: SulP family inorganic anion transporter [Myxococcota bacterium]|nr:SulP family inorganic anion transporter [Myxococcota bacterium]
MNSQTSEAKDLGMFSSLKNDVPASIVVFLVAVPLCLGIALASGAPLFSGIISGIVGGIVVGLLSGSPLGVSGPAAGLAVIVLSAIQDLGAFDVFLSAVVIGGVIQLILGFANAGIVGYFFPNSVIKGMLSAIGIIIFMKQIPHAFGYDKSLGLTQVSAIMESMTTGPIIITSVSMVILILWERPFMKAIKAFQLIQGPLVVVSLGIVFNLVFQGNADLALKPSQVVAIPVAEDFAGFFKLFTFPNFDRILDPAIWITGATIAVVASLETLLCLEATDKLDPLKRVSPPNQELKAQGVGNLLSGLIGGLPVTQVIVRSSTNIQSGGRTKMSAILHGIIMLACAMTVPHILNMIPLASLASILFIVGYKLAKPALFKEMYALGKQSFIPFMTTVIGIIATDLLMGIILGVVVAVVEILINNYKKPFIFNAAEDLKDGKIRLALAEDVTFLNKASIQSSLGQIPDGSSVIIDGSNTVNINYDVQEIIRTFEANAKERNITVEIVNIEPEPFTNQLKVIGPELKKLST